MIAKMKTRAKIPAVLILAAGGLLAQPYDLVVYGATAGGVIASVSAARMGLKVALIEPGKHVGGMVSGGLSHTDVGRREVIGGYSLEFYWRAGLHYGLPQYLQHIAWYVEPKVAEEIFRKMLAEEKIPVFFERRLGSVQKQGTRLASITMESGEQFAGKVFADCSYEGDLMAQAACPSRGAGKARRSMASRSRASAAKLRSTSSS